MSAALDPAGLDAAIARACRAIPPLWPLACSVAVNPFLGQASESLAKAGARLARTAGAPIAMPRRWYAERIADGRITHADLAAAWARAPADRRTADPRRLAAAAQAEPRRPAPPPTVADLAAQASGIDWPGIVAERLGAWAGGYFDEGQALWAAPRWGGAWAAWRAWATHDLTPEIAGLPGFARHAFEAPDTPRAAIARAVARLGLAEGELETFLHQLLASLGGWAQLARQRLWRAELAGEDDDSLEALLAVRLTWEEALFLRHGEAIAAAWKAARAAHAAPVEADADLVIDEILQEAAERAAQRRLAAILEGPARDVGEARPALHAVFCIDVRSEVFRRALESLDPAIRTGGFAGFFGLGAAHRRFASDAEERRLPVLLQPALRSRAGGPADAARDETARAAARARRAWGRFKLAAVSSFAFVEATGPMYAAELARDALGLHGRAPAQDPPPRFDPPLDPAAAIAAARTVLNGMSLTGGFARLVLLVGHGASVVNNPHASALACGACGGHSGEVNARLLAGLLNAAEVRAGLAADGIAIPPDTLFLAALHDTTTDAVDLFDQDHPGAGHAPDLARARAWLDAAGRLARAERALRLPGAPNPTSLVQRGRDWAQTRPEWALAGCAAFIAAPRARTAGRSLEGRAFLHDYDWRSDRGFAVLELILTAPVVVASWISLQYFGSTVAPQAFGAGDKLLHNVTGGVGVVEGAGGPLRGGLPWQSVHDGQRFVHEPLRLSVCVEAPREAIAQVLARHPGVRALFDNRWLHLFALDDGGRLAWRYAGDLAWEPEGTASEAARPELEMA